MDNISFQPQYTPPPAYQAPTLQDGASRYGITAFEDPRCAASYQPAYQTSSQGWQGGLVGTLVQAVAQLVNVVAQLVQRLMGGASAPDCRGDGAAGGSGSFAVPQPLDSVSYEGAGGYPAREAGGGIGGLTEGLGNILSIGKDFFSTIKGGFSNLWGGVKSVFSGIF